MLHISPELVLRPLEEGDLPALYSYKNDPEIVALLGGFSRGYSRTDLGEWLSFHRQRRDEVLWAIADRTEDRCLGHVGLYQIDHRVGSAEFAILFGAKAHWGKGWGQKICRTVIDYAFGELNLQRIQLSVLEHNERAFALYKRLGFIEEGRHQRAQFRDGKYLTTITMALLRSLSL